MTRLNRVLEALTAPGQEGPLTHRVCGVAVELLGVDGAGMTVLIDGQFAVVCSSGVAAADGEVLYLTLGEGPALEAHATGVLTESPDLGEGGRWPMFREAASGLGIRSVASFPLVVGASRIGALSLYRLRPGRSTDDQVAYGYVLAQVAAYLILSSQAVANDEDLIEELEAGFTRLAPVHQAAGMIMVQLGVSPVDAFVRLRARAFASGRSLLEVATDVVMRDLIFEPDGGND